MAQVESGFKVTYATLSAQSDELHAAFDGALEAVRGRLGERQAMRIGGRPAGGAAEIEDRSPIDRRVVVARVPAGTPDDARAAIATARAACPAWAGTPWPERVAILTRAAELISARRYELSAWMALEIGKNRVEALGEVEEAADLIRYYCQDMAAHEGYDKPMLRLSPNEATRSVLRPYGVWVVIAPFNFPLALTAGPAGAALIAGNAVVLKPSSEAPYLALAFADLLAEAGLPDGVCNVVTGSGEALSAALVETPAVDGLLFTGSYAAGFAIYRRFSREYPKPCVTEMGGKNPAIVSGEADLALAVEGIARSAFGYGGQKCSACSRVFVAEPHHDAFLEALAARAKAVVVGDPTRREVYLGPLIRAAKVAEFAQAVAAAARDGRVVCGGTVLRDGALAEGNFVAPTVVAGLADDHPLMREELFMPLVAVAPFRTLDEAIARANAVPYGLTAGFYSRDEDEVRRFLDGIAAGVVYVNRRAGATTGAWPGVQPFGGWKGSGSSGKAGGGPYYLPLFMREQSQTVVEEGG